MRKCVGAPTLTLPYTFPFLSPSRQHTSPLTPYTFPHPYPHFSTPHTSFLTHTHIPTHFPTHPHTSSHSSTHLPLHPNTLPHSPHALSNTSPHIFPHNLDYVAKLPSDDVTLINLTGLWKSLIKFFTTTGNLKSCFRVGNINFRCMKVWRSYWQPKRMECGI